MNATAFNGGKIHLLTEQAARCGVGKHPKYRQWQMDLGEVTCRRCVRLESVAPKSVPPAGGAAGLRGPGDMPIHGGAA